MSRIHLHRTTTVSPQQYLAALIDFGSDRSKIFGNSASEYLKVHKLEPLRADVTEGSATYGNVFNTIGPIPTASFSRQSIQMCGEVRQATPTLSDVKRMALLASMLSWCARVRT
jgi:hypothetical protein